MPEPSTATYEVCGIPVSAAAPAGAAAALVSAATRGDRLEVHLCNAYTLSLVDQDTELREALLASDLNLPDGTPVAWLGRSHGLTGPVRGPALVGEVARVGVPHGVRHYLYGGAPGVAAEMATRLAAHAPGIEIAGSESPPYRDLDDTEVEDLADRVRACGANLVWVGLGTPRQDYLVPRLAQRLEVPVVPVGAAFDFWSDRVREAPKFLHGSGLEWIYRLAAEPRRLWRRYLLGNPRFVWLVLRNRWRP